MGITGLNECYRSNTSSKKVNAKQNSDTETNISDNFKNAILNWEEKVKNKINDDLENDRKKNIKMSQKQWDALMKKVDSAINHNCEDVKSAYSKPDDKNKLFYNSSKKAGVISNSSADTNNSSAEIIKQTDSDIVKVDFTKMTRQDMRDWVNEQILSGKMSLEESSTFVSMTLNSPVESYQLVDNSIDTEYVNFIENVRVEIEGALYNNNSKSIKQLENILDIMIKNQR